MGCASPFTDTAALLLVSKNAARDLMVDQVSCNADEGMAFLILSSVRWEHKFGAVLTDSIKRGEVRRVIATLAEVQLRLQRVFGTGLHLVTDDSMSSLAARYAANLADRHVDLGFNAFSVVSNTYHRENFHSDVLKAFLDPQGAHGEGAIFLETFLSHLKRFSSSLDLRNYTDARVVREEGRIDLLIADETSKRAIIIENKINGAVDMPLQIPRYLALVEQRGYSCDTIVYLRLAGQERPDMTGWTSEQRTAVNKRLVILRTYDETGDDLFAGWITKCIEQCKPDCDAGFLLRHYSQLIKSLGKHVMNRPIMKDFYAAMTVEGRYQSALALKAMLADLTLYRVERIIDEFKHDLAPFTAVANWKDEDAYFTGVEVGAAHFGIDVMIESEVSMFCFWDRNDREGKLERARKLLVRMGRLQEYRFDGGWFVKCFRFPEDETELYVHIRSFKERLSQIVNGD